MVVDNGTLAGIAACLAFYSASGAVLMGWLIWHYRARFAFWKRMALRDQADAIFNICFCGSLALIAFSRASAAYGYITAQWPASAFNIDTSFVYVPMTVLFSGKVCWLSIVIFDKKYTFVWGALTIVGLFIGFAFAH